MTNLLWSYISVKIQFSNSECKHAIRNAECQSMNPEMLFHEVKIQSGNSEPLRNADCQLTKPVNHVPWPIPVKQIKVNENKFKLTKTHPRKRKHFPENGNNSPKTETTPRKRKQLPENGNNSQKAKTNSSYPKQLPENKNNSQKTKPNST